MSQVSFRRLILIRHAKSAWDDPMQNDHARILTARGRRAGDRIGGWLAERGYLPDAALVSDSARTRETWALIAARLPQPPEAVFLEALYHAGPPVMLRVLQAARGNTVAVVGHNPGIAEFARLLVAAPPRHAGFASYPTGATLVADFPISDWHDLRLGTGQVVDFVVPRELD
jgi:phosphohistidine phosphatase